MAIMSSERRGSDGKFVIYFGQCGSQNMKSKSFSTSKLSQTLRSISTCFEQCCSDCNLSYFSSSVETIVIYFHLPQHTGCAFIVIEFLVCLSIYSFKKIIVLVTYWFCYILFSLILKISVKPLT